MRWRRPREQAASEVPGVTSLEAMATGGSSTVYRAWQPALDRWVAIKVLDLTLTDDPSREQFLRECQAVGRLTGHPNIVTVLTAGLTRSDRPYLTMELFARGSLADLVRTSGPAPVDLVLRYGVKLAGALETAHRAGILHRDLKPENVLISRYGEPGLADFGIATVGESRGDTEAFTATHGAPEVLDGRPATATADVYGLGSTLWTALAGRLPFSEGTEGPLRMMLRVLHEPLPPLGRPDVPAAVEEALRWAMAKEPAERAPSALALGERLQSLQVELGHPRSELLVPDLAESGIVDLAERSVVAPATGGVVVPPPGGVGAPRQPNPPSGRETRTRLVPPRQGPPVASGSTLGPGNGERPTRSAVLLPVAIVVAALVVAVTMVSVALLVNRGRQASPPSPSTSAPAPTQPTSTGPPRPRVATGVAVRVVSPTTVVVTWEPPADRSGLLGFVVAHRSRFELDGFTRQRLSNPDALELAVSLPTSGPRCFVVQTLYGFGAGPVSDPPTCT